MTGELQKPGKFIKENPFERVDVRAELDKFYEQLELLRLQYEQFFTGLIPFSPDKLHADVKRRMRKLLKSPFRNSEMNFRLKTLEGRYHTLQSYWQRVLRAREEGTYSKDVFKAGMRERFRLEDQYSQTAEGATEKAMRNLFSTYKTAIEKNSGKAQNLDFDAFKQAIIQRTREFKERNQGQKVSFKVVVSNGKVTLKATAARTQAEKPSS
jgi:hypothetical protein